MRRVVPFRLVMRELARRLINFGVSGAKVSVVNFFQRGKHLLLIINISSNFKKVVLCKPMAFIKTTSFFESTWPTKGIMPKGLVFKK